jgi:putrescine---pyruvate transaminase
LMPGFFQIEAPFVYRNPWGTDDESRVCDMALAELDRTLQFQGPGTVAAFMAEPVQGAGGVIVPPAAYWPGVRKILDKYGVLLIADEVVTGFGRIGSMSGARAWGVKPDIMAMAKGINSGYVPLGATLVNERVYSAWTKAAAGEPLAALMHGYTYSGHALACAAANANLTIVENEDLPGNAATVGAYMQQRLAELKKYRMVGDVRGKGLMAVIELVIDKSTKEALPATHPYSLAVAATARQEGALVRTSGHLMILSPPLIFTRQHVDQMVSILHAAFAHAEHSAA